MITLRITTSQLTQISCPLYDFSSPLYQSTILEAVLRGAEVMIHQFLFSELCATDCRARAEHDGTRAETTFRLSPKRTSPFKSAGQSVQSTAGSRGVRISVSNAGYTTFRGSVRVLATHSTRQFPLHFPSLVPPHSERGTVSCSTHFLPWLNSSCIRWVSRYPNLKFTIVFQNSGKLCP